jgi:hypothetical protein
MRAQKLCLNYYEATIEEDIHFDPVAIRCDFTEYENFEEGDKRIIRKTLKLLDQLL